MKYITILFIFFISSSFSQTLTYVISADNSPIGSLVATKYVKNDITEVEILSEVSIKLFIKIELKYTLNCTYKNNELLFSSLKIYVNGKIHTTNTTQKIGNSYTITSNGHTSIFLNKIIYSGALLYFDEPKKQKKKYSEFNNIEKDIKILQVNEYQITNPENGLKNEYVYSGGFLISSTIHHKLLNFTITKK